MKYFIECSGCGAAYEVTSEMEPKFCTRCGYAEPKVERRKRGRVDYDAVESELAELEGLISAVKENEEREIERIKRESSEQIAKYRVRLQELKNKMRWKKYSQVYVPVDHSGDRAMQMFGKRMRDLTPDEYREYNRILARESRERRRKTEG